MDQAVAIDLDDIGEDFTHCFTGECRVNVLPILFQISEIITESEDLQTMLAIILKVMQERLKIARGMVTLYDREAERIFIHESFGLTDEQKARGIYSPGEGITGKVVEAGKPIIVPRLRDNPSSLPHTISGKGANKNASFFCVPILHAKKVLGTISAERVYHNRRLLKQDVELLSTIASMIAPAVELYLMENIDKVRLENENRRLTECAETALQALQHHRQLQADAGCLRTHSQGGGHQGDRPDPRRKRRRQGACRQRHPLQRPHLRWPVHQVQLRRAAGKHRRERAVRPRERLVHGRHRDAQGPLRDGRRRLDLPRRDRRAEPSHAGEALAGAAGKDLRARRRHAAGQGRPPHHRGDEPEPARHGRERHVPRGSVLPVERVPDHHPAASRAERATSFCSPTTSSRPTPTRPART